MSPFGDMSTNNKLCAYLFYGSIRQFQFITFNFFALEFFYSNQNAQKHCFFDLGVYRLDRLGC